MTGHEFTYDNARIFTMFIIRARDGRIQVVEVEIDVHRWEEKEERRK